MQPAHPLDLLDILSFVALYVRSRDLPNCLLVSRTWHQAFLPFVWKDIALDEPSEAAVQVHRHLVRRLEIQHNSGHLDTLHLPNLDIVSVYCPSQDPIVPFIMRHPTLNCIELPSNIMGIDATFWNTLLGFQHLRELVVGTAEVIGPISSRWFWQLCAQLDRLVLTANSNAESHSIPTIEFSRIRDLSLIEFQERHTEFCVQLMEQCPNLESITWQSTTSYASTIVARLDPLLQALTWPRLERLNFKRHRFTSLEFAVLVRRLPRITSLKFDFCHRRPMSDITQLLRPHFAHLQHIDLQPRHTSQSSLAQVFLSSCPLLETLKAPRVNAQNVALGEPWVCLRLKVLHLQVFFNSFAVVDEVQHLVFDQISRLVGLEELHFQGKYQGLKPRLECGLGKLSTLRSLHTITFEDSPQIVGRPEIDWILEHWKSLMTIKGMLNSSGPSTDGALIRRLKDHGIDV
ncbi:hypothetical protein B0O80DRAFT_247375 [Mortierella sp. GBAus27b]|nr:hypothetical protein B0O80DRAFT_247375 [Mortierella sp. GBAus27b]